MRHCEKYLISQLETHICQLPPSDDYEFSKRIKKIKNYFLISEKSPRAYLKAKTLAAIYYEKRRQIRTTTFLVIHPYSDFNRFYQFLRFFFLLHCFTLFPFTVSFLDPAYVRVAIQNNYSFETFYVFIHIHTCTQLLSVVDIFVNFISGYVNKATGEVVIQHSKISKHYFSTYFCFDFLSALPINFLILSFMGLQEYSKLRPSSWIFFTTLPLLKLSRLPTLNKSFYAIFEYFATYDIYYVVAGSVLFVLIAHWGACLNNMIPHLLSYDYLFEQTPALVCNSTWMRSKDIMVKPLFTLYTSSAYRSVTSLVSIGFDISCLHNIEDKLLAIFLGILGMLYWLGLLSVYLLTISSVRRGHLDYIEVMWQVKQYMRHRKLPKKLRKKIEIYYEYFFRKQFIGERNILQLLSENLRQEITLRIHERLIEKIEVFSGLNKTLLYNIISCLKSEIYLPNDVVYKVGEVGDSMYFINFGTVASYLEDGLEVSHSDDGDYFGEVALIFNFRRVATVVAIETTELHRLSAEDFQNIIKPHPAIYLRIEKIALERYRDLFQDTSINLKNPSFKRHRRGSEDEDDFEEEKYFLA